MSQPSPVTPESLDDSPDLVSEENVAVKKPSKLDDPLYRQALQIGYIEMERITEQIIMPVLTYIGGYLRDLDYDCNIITFDAKCEIDERIYDCGAGLRVERGHMRNAFVFTGDPYKFKFYLQTLNFANKETDNETHFHELIPQWIYNESILFVEESLRDVDIEKYKKEFGDSTPPTPTPIFIKMKNKDGEYNEIAKADTLAEAINIGSTTCKFLGKPENIQLVDSEGNILC